MIEIKLDARRFGAEIERIHQRLTDTAPLMQNIGTLLEKETSDAFQEQRAADGTAWQAHSAVTTLLRAKRSDTGPGQILRDTGALQNSVFSDSGDDWATVGAGSGPSAAYAMIHQFGGQAGRGKKVAIPARPYLPITDKELAKATQENCISLVMEYLQS